MREEVSDLGEGTHTFHVFVYPNVTGGESLVNATMLDKNVTLSESRLASLDRLLTPEPKLKNKERNNVRELSGKY